MNPVRISILVMAGMEVGAGHYVRCKALAEELQRDCHFVELIVIEEQADYENLYISFQCEAPDIIIFDMPVERYDISFITKIRELNQSILVCIDDEDLFHDSTLFDLKICCSIRFRKHAAIESRVLYGPQYMMIHPKYSSFPTLKRVVNDQVNKLLLSFGGSDPNQIAVKLLRVLTSSEYRGKSYNLDVIMGVYANPIPAELLRQSTHKIEIFHNISDMPARLWNTDLALVSGGMTLYESVSLGTPTIVISQNDEQAREAAIFNELGCIVDMGIHNEFDQARWITILTELEQCHKRRSLSETSRKYIDGRGIQRVREAIVTIAMQRT